MFLCNITVDVICRPLISYCYGYIFGEVKTEIPCGLTVWEDSRFTILNATQHNTTELLNVKVQSNTICYITSKVLTRKCFLVT